MNGFKVGPNYQPAPAPAAPEWIDSGDKRFRTESDDLSKWWKVFNDPVLDAMICDAYRQNLTLREAGYRILQARAQLGIAVANVLPQTQDFYADYNRKMLSATTANNFLMFPFPGVKRSYSQFDFNFNLAWELDFWGKFRRAVEANSATLDASVEDFDDALVTMLGDIATNYVQLRTVEEQIRFTKENIALQRSTLDIISARYFKGKIVSELDYQQQRGVVAQTEALIPELEIQRRQYENQLCILMGIPPQALRDRLGKAPIPGIPDDMKVAVGIPADLLRRRPDVRRAERQAAAQCAQIGVAEADFLPHISIAGTIGYSAASFSSLFSQNSLTGSVGPTFQWNILNYGKILNNRRVQDAKFRELIATYQKTALNAEQEVENGLITFVRAQQRSKFQAESVDAAVRSTNLVLLQYEKGGIVDLTRVVQLQLNQVDQQNLLAQVKGEIARGLIQVYKALGGGWELRQTGCDAAWPILAAPVEDGELPREIIKLPQ
jgi:NodT family efflux transporter outer membrane factor (OMF) lipoprotein